MYPTTNFDQFISRKCCRAQSHSSHHTRVAYNTWKVDESKCILRIYKMRQIRWTQTRNAYADHTLGVCVTYEDLPNMKERYVMEFLSPFMVRTYTTDKSITLVEKFSKIRWGYASDIVPRVCLSLMSCLVTWFNRKQSLHRISKKLYGPNKRSCDLRTEAEMYAVGPIIQRYIPHWVAQSKQLAQRVDDTRLGRQALHDVRGPL